MKHIKHIKRWNKIKCAIILACLSSILLSTNVSAYAQLNTTAKTSTKKQEEKEILGYVGKVLSDVNVRVGAGASNDKVMQNGKGVYLVEGDEVLIISEVMVGSKPWYEIKFTKNGEELTGFSSSSFITKTDKVITPTPLPTKEATPTPEPTETPIPTALPTISALPTSAPEENMDQAEDGGNGNLFFIVLGIVVIAGATGAIIIYLKKQRNEKTPTQVITKKVENLENIQIERNTSVENSVPVIKRKAEVKPSTINVEPSIQKKTVEEKQIKSVLQNAKEELAATTVERPQRRERILTESDRITKLNVEDVKATIEMDSKEKKALRKAIEELREHDIIIHKFWGRGEVFDNSDVKLIEIRFGGDARFLNKESLVSKKLISITKERNI